MPPADSALGIFRSQDHDLCVPGRRILHPPRTLIGNVICSQLDHAWSSTLQMEYNNLFVLRFYGPINSMGSCRAWSVYLTAGFALFA